MTPTLIWIITLLVAYLLGSIPTGYLLVRFFKNEDVRATGSGNIGATNVARSGGKGLGIATLVLDALKGFVAVAFAWHMAQRIGFPSGYDLEAMAGLFAVLGHMYTVWLGFKGGKGVATALGVFLYLMPSETLAAVVIFAIVFALTKYVSLASVISAVGLAVLCIVFDWRHQIVVDLVYIAIPLLVIVKHHANISRLLNRTEPKFGAKKKEA
ncbi:glycerol-3-phosphate 1-O-acyltransferase PlsY [Terriglobus sp. TAA 43]|uniref:glycerol-3-phosphate 1-O-acyltransferase PlsY n=1 Tax=Terriglobus sp. TAA 43 TaxID=278961 RepID=UPI000648D645|nr:glycerol-3-phosphate 1-O-acyltransferase PlsY [Terriglobus sp. TAA 43]